MRRMVRTESDPVLDLIEQALRTRGVRGVAGAIATLIRSGALTEGTRLPPVRRLAAYLGVSPTTVAAAWSQLASLGLISSHGRRGTFVASPPARRPRRWRSSPTPLARYDLGTGAPDPLLLPNPLAYLKALSHPQPVTYTDPPVLESLAEVLWPLLPEGLHPERGGALAVVDGALEAIDLLLGTLAPNATSVAVEDPSFPALFDLVETHGLSVVAIPVDRDGPDPTSLERAAALPELGAFITQPRAQNPTGVSTSPRRRDALAHALARRPDVLVIEDDHSGLLAAQPLATLAGLHPTTAYVLSFSKSHGPDLRLAAVVTHSDRCEALEQARSLGPSWSSKLLQSLLAGMLRDPGEAPRLEQARSEYQRRRSRLGELFEVELNGDGINVWVPPLVDTDLALELAHRGVRVIPGSAFSSQPDVARAARITLAEPRHAFDTVVAYLAETAALPPQANHTRRAPGR